MAKVGIVFGCFIPMHTGHLKMIDRSITENDVTILGVCGYDDDRGKDFLSFQERQDIIRRKTFWCRSIALSVVDDRKIGLTGKFDKESWELWSNEFFRYAGADPYSNNEFTWYTGEQRYIDVISQIFPKHKFVLLERDGVSGTAIRENPQEHLDEIDPDFRRYLIEHNRI